MASPLLPAKEIFSLDNSVKRNCPGLFFVLKAVCHVIFQNDLGGDHVHVVLSICALDSGFVHDLIGFHSGKALIPHVDRKARSSFKLVLKLQSELHALPFGIVHVKGFTQHDIRDTVL